MSGNYLHPYRRRQRNASVVLSLMPTPTMQLGGVSEQQRPSARHVVAAPTSPPATTTCLCGAGRSQVQPAGCGLPPVALNAMQHELARARVFAQAISALHCAGWQASLPTNASQSASLSVPLLPLPLFTLAGSEPVHRRSASGSTASRWHLLEVTCRLLSQLSTTALPC